MKNPFKVKLPTTVEEFDSLVDRVASKFTLSDKNHAAAIISVAIRHLPNDQAYTTYSYLGQSVLKNLANYVANYKGQTIQQDTQVRQLIEMLTQDPNNQQAIDELQKASDQGNDKAKSILLKLNAVAEPALEVVVPENVQPERQ